MSTNRGQLPVEFATVTAIVSLLMAVDQVVFVQRRVLCKPFATVLDRANIRLLPGVNAAVVPVVGGRGKLPPTALILALIWFLASMDPHVHLPDVGCREGFLTNLALKWPFACVSADVFLQVSGGLETLATPLLRALVRLLPRVGADVGLQRVAGGEALLAHVTDVRTLAGVVTLVGF